MSFVASLLGGLRSRWHGSLRLRQTVGLSVVILAVMSVGSGAMLYEQGTTIRQAAEARGLAFSRTFAVMGAAAVLDNLFRVQEAMNQILQDPDILEIDVIDPDNMVVASKHPQRIGAVLNDPEWIAPPRSQKEVITYATGADGGPLFVIVEPLMDQGKIAAWTRIVFSLNQVRAQEWQSIQRMTLVTLALILAGIIGVHLSQRKVSNIFRGIVNDLQQAVKSLGLSQQQSLTASTRNLHREMPSLPQPAQGEFEYLTSIVTETAELLRKQSEVLRESEMKYRSVAQSANDAIVSADQDGNIIAWNNGAERIFGYKEEEILQRPLTSLMPERYKADHERGFLRMRTTGEGRAIGQTLELAGRRKDGHEFPLELSIASWKTGEGTFYTGIIRDITERKRAREALEALTASLEQKVKERTEELEIARDQALLATHHKSEFLASMSHELRTPLNAVIGFSEVLLERMFGDINQKQEEYIEDILTSGRHLLTLINDILDLSKIESGRMDLELTTFDLRAALESTLALIRERAHRSGIDVALRADDGLGEFTADERKMKQVLLNLLSNAVKFTRSGGRVLVRTTLNDEVVEITVTDTGIGIAPEHQEKIFEEFFQVRGSGQKREGTGLGLTLAKKFVELHGGRIWVESAIDRGSTFAFTLLRRTPVEQVSAPGGEEPIVPAKYPTVLIVEDDPSATKLLSAYLMESGFVVETAQDGETGFEKAQTIRPAIITLDVLMPKVDGWDLLSRLKDNPRTAHIPVVIVSIVDERGKGFALGAAEYLTKPIRRDELLSTIRRVGGIVTSHHRDVTILAIDDDPMVLELMEAVLRSEGFSVLKATGGTEGLALARERRPNLIILDLLLPDVDGFEVVDELKRRPTTADIPILILTSKTLSTEDKDRLNGRISDLKQKGDFSRSSFVAQVRALLQLRES